MSEVVYDVPISEVAKLLSKSDRQVRRYVKERRLKAAPLRIEGHVKLMFSRDEVMAFGEQFVADGVFGESGDEIIVDAQVIGKDTSTDSASDDDVDVLDVGASSVKYAIDVLREQLKDQRKENKDLHYQLEQRSGQVGFLQSRVESLQDEIKALMPAPKPEAVDKKPWFKRIFSRD